MRLRALIAAALLVGAAALAEEGPPVQPEPVPEKAPSTIRFKPVDVWVHTGGERLAAYQVELTYDKSRVQIVGVEGGDKGPFNEAPYFDPRGKAGGRMVVAAFTADDARAPEGRLRIARLHLRIVGPADADPDITIRLVTAARPGGGKISPEVELTRPGEQRGEKI